MLDPNWHSVSRQEPCPICKHTSWCILTNDGGMCICRRVESAEPAASGNGWKHRLKENGFHTGVGVQRPMVGGGFQPPRIQHTTQYSLSQGMRRTQSVRPTTPQNDIDIAAYFAQLPTTKDNLQERMCGYLEKQLGLPMEIMLKLDWRWDLKARVVAIPMRNPEGYVTGIRYRALDTGKKWAKTGSKDGLFFDPAFVPVSRDEIMVCEGPTDQAAAMACGFWCLGRSSCGTGRDLIIEFAKKHHIKRVTIFSDFDKPKIRPDGSTWCPGQEGAERLGRELHLPYRIVYPPIRFKDLREWYRTGKLDHFSLDQAVKGSAWKGPCHD